MRESYKRCSHCGVEYLYQSSGPGCGDSLNSSKFCEGCQGAINAALAAIPRRFEERYLNVNESPRFPSPTLDQVLSWERENDRVTAESGAPLIRRIWPSLINLETGDTQFTRQVRGRDAPFTGILFRVTTWRSSPKDYSIETSMEWDAQKKCFTGHRWPH